jgi:DnaJ-class molecular chaperone
MTTATRSEQEQDVENYQREQAQEAAAHAAWVAEHPDKCPKCYGVGMAWDYIHALHDTVIDRCASCNGTGRI